MNRQHLVTRAEIRAALVTWLVLVLLAAAINVPLAVSRWRPHRATPIPRPPLQGAAAARPWPSSTPHATAWPTPEYWSEWRGFGWRRYDVGTSGSSPGTNGYQMKVEQFGWPLPVIEHKEMWWDWNNLALAGHVPDPTPRLLSAGLVLNPVMVGTGASAILLAPWLVWVLVRRTRRRSRDECARCGYPIGVSPVCTECGQVVRVAKPATT